MKIYLEKHFEKRKFLLMSIFIFIHTSIFLVFSSTMFINNQDNKLNIYLFTILLFFILFKLHFAHHSIIKKNFIELTAFLVISLISSVLIIYIIQKFFLAFQDEKKSNVNFYKNRLLQ